MENEFKVGDKVVVSSSQFDDYIDIIERITPTGRIITKKAGTYGKDGHEIAKGWHRRMILPVTPERIHAINNKNRRKFLNGYDWMNKLSDDVITQIRNIIRECETEK